MTRNAAAVSTITIIVPGADHRAPCRRAGAAH
jgi:hypothetical protein